MSKNRFDKVWSDNDDEEEKDRIEEISSEEDDEDADTLYDMVFEAENSDLLCVNENGKTNEIQAYGTAKIALVPKPESDEVQPVLYFFDGEDDNAPLSFQEIVEKNSPYLDLEPADDDRGVTFKRRNRETEEDQQVIITFPSSDACIEFMRVFETAKISPNDLSVVGQMAPVYNDENDDDSSDDDDDDDDSSEDDEGEEGENPFSNIKKGESLGNGPIFGNSSSGAPEASPVKSLDSEKKLFNSIFENAGANIFGGSAGNIFSPRQPHVDGAENVTTPLPTTGLGKGNIFSSPSPPEKDNIFSSPSASGGIFSHARTSERPTPVASEALGEKDKGAATIATTEGAAGAAALAPVAEEKPQEAAEEEYDPEEEVLVIPGWTPPVNLNLKETTETGEEDEDELYSERCKVYRFRDGDWKERGLGDCKIQRNRTAGKIRMLLRQEKTNKIVLLHVISGAHESLCDLVFHDDTQKIYSYMCQDYSEEKTGEMTHIAIRFKDAVIASEFKKAFDDAKVAGDAAPGSSVKASSPKASAEKTPEQAGKPESAPSSMFTNALPTSSFGTDGGMSKTASDSKKNDAANTVGLANNSLFAQSASTESSDNPFASVALARGASGFPGFSSSPSAASPNGGGAPADGGLFGSTFSAAPNTTYPSPCEAKANADAAEENEDDVEAEVVNIPGWTPSITLDVKDKVETGEEDEEVLAAIRAKLYRFREGEWKERGLGDVKLLQNPTTKKVRCLLRQEHTNKIACNFLIADEAPYCDLQPNPGSEKAWVFSAHDNSDGEMNVEQFCARFRDVTAAGEFKKAFDAAKKGEKVTINLPAGANSPKKDSKQKEADQKPASPSKAATSEVPKTGLFGASAPTSGTSIFGTPTQVSSLFGTKKEDAIPTGSLFGTKKEDPAPTGGLFGTKKEDPATTGGLLSNLKKEDEKPATGGLFGSPAPSGGLFNSPAPSGSLFGTPPPTSGCTKGCCGKKKDEKPVSLSKEDSSTPEAKDESATSGIFSGVFAKPPGQSSDAAGGLFAGSASGVAWPGSQAPILFSSPGGTKTTVKDEVRKSDDAEEEDNVEEEVEVIPGWAPSITLELKDKIETGEEDEEELYSIRGKLFRFRDSEWKERGVGTIRLLRNKQRNVRFLLRQDNTSKIVANFFVVEQHGVCELNDNPGSAKALQWAALDSSEGETIMEQFCMRVKDVQQKEEFQRAFEAAKKGEAIPREPAKPSSDAPNVTTTSPTPPAVSVSQTSAPESTTTTTKSGIFGTQPFSTTSITNTNALFTVPEVAAAPAPAEDEQEPNIEEEVFTIPGWSPSVTLDVKEKVDTGEEGEEILYCIRAKLYRFREDQWKERGLGDVKLLRNNETQKVRFLMRQERTGKIVGNFFLTHEAPYCDLQPAEGNEKAWVFSCLDYSEGEMMGEQMCMRLKDVPTKEEFKRAFDAGKKGEKIEDVTYGTQGAQASQSGGGKPSNESTLGAKKEAPAETTTPLPTATGSVFNSSGTTSGGLFSSINGASKSATSGGLFSTAAAGAPPSTTSGGLFSTAAAGAPPSTKIGGGLFSTAATTGASTGATSGGLFSSAIGAGTTASSTSGGLFDTNKGAAGATSTTSGGALFGSKVALGTGGGLFGNSTGTLFGTDKGAPEEEKPPVSVEAVNLEDEDTEVEVFHIPGWEPSVNLEVLDAVTTGEEKEDPLYCERAKLYRFRDEMWKERGTGEARLLKNRDTGVIRFLMRQDKTNKICANFVVTDKPPYCDLLEHDNEKAWVFTAQDWSDGESVVEKFLIRFKTKEIREAFKPHFDAAKKGEAYAGGIVKTRMSSITSPTNNNVFSSSPLSSPHAKTGKDSGDKGSSEGFATGANAIPLGVRSPPATQDSTYGEGFLTGANAIPLGSRSSANPPANSIFAGFKDRKEGNEEKYNDEEQPGISVESLKRFDGTWTSIYDGEPRAHIEDGIITSLYGSTDHDTAELYQVTNNKVEVCWPGQDTWIGTLQPDGRLEWDDEDVWEKQDEDDEDDEHEGPSQAEVIQKMMDKQNDPNNWSCPVCNCKWPQTLDACGACETTRPGLDPDAVAKEKAASKNKALGAFLGSAAPSAGASGSGGNSIFGGGAPVTSSSVFGAPAAASGSQTTSSVFGAPAAASGSQTTSSIFGAPTTSNVNIAPKAGAPSPSSIFGAPTFTPSDTTIEPKAAAPSPPSSSIFGAPQTSFSSSAGPPQTTTSSSVFNVFGGATAGATAAPAGYPGVAAVKAPSVLAPTATGSPQMGAAQSGFTQYAAPPNHPVPPIQKDMVPASQIVVPSPKVPMIQPSPQMLRPLINQIVFEEIQKWDLKLVQLEYLVNEMSAKTQENEQGSLERERQTHEKTLDFFTKKVGEVTKKVGEVLTTQKIHQKVDSEKEEKAIQLEAKLNEITQFMNEIKTRFEAESTDSLRRENQELRVKMETIEANARKDKKAQQAMEDEIRQLKEKLLSKGEVREKAKTFEPNHQTYNSTIPLGRRLFGDKQRENYRPNISLDGTRDVNLMRPRDNGFAKEN